MRVVFGGVTFFSYAETYLDAARRLASLETREFREGDWNMFVMPLLFLFRHYVELGLKACICMKKEIKILKVLSQPGASREEVQTARETMDEQLKCTHDVANLLRDMEKDFPEREWHFSKEVRDYFNQLSGYDKRSDVFRYPFDTKGDWILPEEPIMTMREIKKMIEDSSRELNAIAVQLMEDILLLRW